METLCFKILKKKLPRHFHMNASEQESSDQPQKRTCPTKI
jgi:hypothetical protein